jgi:hypothetical protein
MTTENKPNFFVIGASKSGTTSLCELLASHPDVFMSDPKEPSYFSRGESLGLSAESYASIFAEAAGYRAVGEGSTEYAVVGLFPGIEQRLAEYAPAARLIYIVRHPLERIESQWIQLRSMGAAPADFRTALREIPEIIEGNLYWKNVSAYRRAFSEDQILVLFFDDLKVDTAATVARCFEFLGLDPGVELDDPGRPRNTRRIKRSDKGLLSALRRVPGYDRLRDVLVPESVRPAVKKLFTEPVPQYPEWDRESFDWLVERLRPDTVRLLEEHGKPGDFWDLSPAWLERRQSTAARGEGSAVS